MVSIGYKNEGSWDIDRADKYMYIFTHHESKKSPIIILPNSPHVIL